MYNSPSISTSPLISFTYFFKECADWKMNGISPRENGDFVDGLLAMVSITGCVLKAKMKQFSKHYL